MIQQETNQLETNDLTDLTTTVGSLTDCFTDLIRKLEEPTYSIVVSGMILKTLEEGEFRASCHKPESEGTFVF